MNLRHPSFRRPHRIVWPAHPQIADVPLPPGQHLGVGVGMCVCVRRCPNIARRSNAHRDFSLDASACISQTTTRTASGSSSAPGRPAANDRISLAVHVDRTQQQNTATLTPPLVCTTVNCTPGPRRALRFAANNPLAGVQRRDNVAFAEGMVPSVTTSTP